MLDRHDLTDEEWARLEPLLPDQTRRRGGPWADHRMVLERGVLADAVRGRRGQPGRPRRRPEKVHADKGYDYPRCRRYLQKRGIKVRIARRGIEDKSKLGRVPELRGVPGKRAHQPWNLPDGQPP